MKDAILLALIAAVEAEEPLEAAVTLLVSGFLVSGFVVSYDKFMKQHPLTVEVLKIPNEPDPESPEPTDNIPEFIHLRDARYFVPGGNPIPGNTGIFVRIPLDSIHGFSFGLLET